MDDLLDEFPIETSESLPTLDVGLVRLEQNPNDPDPLGNIFGLMYTMKGTRGFLGLPPLEAVAKSGENVPGKLCGGEQELAPVAVSLILACLDQIRVILMALEETEAEPEGDDSDLIGRLDALASGVESTPQAAEAAAVELVRASPNSEHTTERIDGTPVLRLHNRPLPLVNLRERLKLEMGERDQAVAEAGQSVHGFIVVAQVGA